MTQSTLNVSEVARQVGMSSSHFWRRFRKVTGVTPYAAFIQLKMKRAGQMLSESDQAIKVIASDLGFVDLRTFSRLFRRLYGMTPSTFRQCRKASLRGADILK
jgi:AraC-like DNA-binding protein